MQSVRTTKLTEGVKIKGPWKTSQLLGNVKNFFFHQNQSFQSNLFWEIIKKSNWLKKRKSVGLLIFFFKLEVKQQFW